MNANSYRTIELFFFLLMHKNILNIHAFSLFTMKMKHEANLLMWFYHLMHQNVAHFFVLNVMFVDMQNSNS